MSSTLFSRISVAQLPAIKTATAKNFFSGDPHVMWLAKNPETFVDGTGRIERDVPARTIVAYSPTIDLKNEGDRDALIVEALEGKEVATISRAHIAYLIRQQPTGENGLLLAQTSSHNIAYLRDRRGNPRLVCWGFVWGRGWHVVQKNLTSFGFAKEQTRVFAYERA
jgi:hypothetical protein